MTVPTVVASVRQQEREQQKRYAALLLVMLVATAFAGLLALRTAPQPFSLALVLLGICAVIAFVHPVAGVYLMLFLTLIGDMATSAWWPFTKNLSSRESILFVSDALSVTPLEMLLAVAWLAYILRGVADRNWQFRCGVLRRPILVLAAFLFIGVAYGLSSGGDRQVAIMEARPLVYFVLMYLLIVNVCTERRHYRRALALSMVAIAIQAVLSLNYYTSLDAFRREHLEDLLEHTATVHMNSLFLLTLSLFLFGGTRWKKWTMLTLSIPVGVAYILSQRRGAMVAFFVGVMMLFVVLYRRRRQLFWMVVPPLTLMALAFLGGTWNASGGLGLPATAVKSALFPDSLGDVDKGSDMYRQAEAFNLWSTIQASPVLGRGFGRPFDVVQQMPDISFFVFWQYLPHNSILWVWIKLGFFGFVTVLYLLALAIRDGARAAVNERNPDDVSMVMAGLGYVVMFTVFSYVDIGFGIRPMVYLALAVALSADFARTPEVAPAPPVRARRALPLPPRPSRHPEVLQGA